MTLEWPAALLIMFIILVVVVAAFSPMLRRHELQMAEIKAKGHEEYKALAERSAALAQETRGVLAAMQSDLSALRVSVEKIETMMREVS